MAKTKMTVAGILGRITYTTVYVFLCIVLAVLLLLVPADIVRQVLSHNTQRSNVLVLVIVYVLTLIIVLFVYALRLYTTRTLLASIPKPHFPAVKGAVNKEVHAMIVANLGRSAAIAWEAYPKVVNTKAHRTLGTIEEGADAAHEDEMVGGQPQKRHEQDEGRIRRFWNRLGRQRKEKMVSTAVENRSRIALQSIRPVWGHVEHDGWASPESSDLPELQYGTVLAELPNLIEAKAVSLAPRDPEPSASSSPALDPEAVVLLRRAPHMTMRDYIGSLTGFGMLPSGANGSEGQAPPLVPAFLDAYERARFSTRPMPQALFRNLMHLFAEILRAIRPPDQSLLYGDDDGSQDEDEGGGYGDGVSLTESDGHIDDNAPRDGSPTTPTPTRSISGASLHSRRSEVSNGGDSAPSGGMTHYSRRRPPGRQRYRRTGRDGSSAIDTRQRYRTGPTTPMSRFHDSHGGGGNGTMTSESSESLDTFTRTRRPYPYSSTTTSLSSSASASLRSLSQRSRRSGPPPSTSGSDRSLSLSRTQSQQGSVIIRLAGPEDGPVSGGLPYVLMVGGN